jgi:hypothetical protein
MAPVGAIKPDIGPETLTPVVFGDTLIGSRMPSLTYMLTFSDTAALTEKVESVLGRSRVERAVSAAREYRCGDCEQHLKSLSQPTELLADSRGSKLRGDPASRLGAVSAAEASYRRQAQP